MSPFGDARGVRQPPLSYEAEQALSRHTHPSRSLKREHVSDGIRRRDELRA
jgi:hypothetical protein